MSLKIIANIGDKATLQSILQPQHFPVFLDEETEASAPYNDTDELPATDNSMDTIDSFLNKFGGNLQATGYLAHAQFSSEESDESRSPASSAPARKDEEKTLLKEEKISEERELKHLIQSHKYREALELIERQNLNNPQKSIYFAHQMRFIKKLMALEKFKNKSK